MSTNELTSFDALIEKTLALKNEVEAYDSAETLKSFDSFVDLLEIRRNEFNALKEQCLSHGIPLLDHVKKKSVEAEENDMYLLIHLMWREAYMFLYDLFDENITDEHTRELLNAYKGN